jgi:hypothetical protein
MSYFGLLIVAIIAAGSVVWLVTYADIIKTIGGKTWSPRLVICRFLVPLDVIITLILILGPMLGGMHGIQSFICSVFVGAGLSVGVAFTRRILMPKWQKEYKDKKAVAFVVA